ENMATTEITRKTPVTELSFCVTPCWIKSPMTTSMMRSKGSREVSSRRPATRITRKTNVRTMAARRIRSIVFCLREDGHTAVEVRDRETPVAKLDVLRAVTEGG